MAECNQQSYQYYIYAGLGILFFASESLGLPKQKTNNVQPATESTPV